MSMTTPEIGELVRVRGQHWVVADVHRPDRTVEDCQTLVDLLSVSDGGYGDELQVIWEVEPAAKCWRLRRCQTSPRMVSILRAV